MIELRLSNANDEKCCRNSRQDKLPSLEEVQGIRMLNNDARLAMDEIVMQDGITDANSSRITAEDKFEVRNLSSVSGRTKAFWIVS